MQVIIGLGNPGSRYAATRHNMGFMVVNRLAAAARCAWCADEAVHSHLATVPCAGAALLLVKPQTYMNRSGLAALSVQRRLGSAPEEMLVVLDDFQLDFGRVRLRPGGRDGGHQGLASMLEHLGTTAIPRLRLGVGAPPPQADVVDYVLEPFAPDDDVEALLERGCGAVETWAHKGIEAAMNRFNGCEALDARK